MPRFFSSGRSLARSKIARPVGARRLGRREIRLVVEPAAGFLDVDHHRVDLRAVDQGEQVIEAARAFEDGRRRVEGPRGERLEGDVLCHLPADCDHGQPIACPLVDQRPLLRGTRERVAALLIGSHRLLRAVHEDPHPGNRHAARVGDDPAHHVRPQPDRQVPRVGNGTGPRVEPVERDGHRRAAHGGHRHAPIGGGGRRRVSRAHRGAGQ